MTRTDVLVPVYVKDPTGPYGAWYGRPICAISVVASPVHFFSGHCPKDHRGRVLRQDRQSLVVRRQDRQGLVAGRPCLGR
jgi:hypothetical protein